MTLLLKKSTLEKNFLTTDPSLILLSSKIVERVVKSRPTDYLASNYLLNPHQSAYYNITPLKPTYLLIYYSVFFFIF